MLNSYTRIKIALISAFLLFGLELFLVTFNLQTITLLELAYLQKWQIPLAYVDLVGKLILIGGFVWWLLARDYIAHYWSCLQDQFKPKRFILGMVLQLVSFLLLFLLSQLLFGSNDIPAPVFHWASVCWLLAAILAVVFIPTSLVPLSQSLAWFKAEKGRLLAAALITLVVWKLAKWSQSIWGQLEGDGLAGATFQVVEALLRLVSSDRVYSDVAERTMGIGTFSVYIAPECSGYEGVGLVCAALGLYLGLYRRDYRFPQVLVLFPLGAALVWLLNCIRIAALVLIGNYWSEDIAVGGFHSQAGWISFIVTAVLLLWYANNAAWLLKKPVTKSEKTSINLPIATLVPLVGLLASTLLTSAFVSDFNYAYPVRVVVVAAAIYYVWPQLRLYLPGYRPSWQAGAGAILVTVLWVVFHGNNAEANAAFDAGLASMTPFWAGVWLLMRVIGAVITVPVAEELAFRGYMLCKLSGVEVSIKGRLPFVWVAVVVSSLAFGALHGAWIAGTLAGLVYAWVRYRSQHIVDAIFAHGATNALIAIYAVITGNWWLL